MKKYSLFKRFMVLLCFMAVGFSFLLYFSVSAGETASATQVEVVFLLDTSVSMNTQDENWQAIDAICQAAYNFPQNYQVGFVAYHTEIKPDYLGRSVLFARRTQNWKLQRKSQRNCRSCC